MGGNLGRWNLYETPKGKEMLEFDLVAVFFDYRLAVLVKHECILYDQWEGRHYRYNVIGEG